MSETITFNGVLYRKNEKTGYYETNCRKYKRLRLHQAVWEYYTGKKIPKGYHIHHIDLNKDNNNFENLQCLSQEEHTRLHSQLLNIWQRPDMKKANIKGREKCKLWHKSEKGKQWHSEHQKEYIKKILIKEICTECGVEFNTFNDKRHQTKCRKCRDRLLKRELRQNK